MTSYADKVIRDLNVKAAMIEAEEVERRIIAGEDRVELRTPFGFTVHEVPGWRDAPASRLRVEWHRLKARRAR